MRIRTIYRRDRHLRGGDHIGYLEQDYPAARFTEPTRTTPTSTRTSGWRTERPTGTAARSRSPYRTDGSAGGHQETVDGADWGEVVNIAYRIAGEDFAAGRFDRVYPGIEVA